MSEIYGSRFQFLFEIWHRIYSYNAQDNELLDEILQEIRLRKLDKIIGSKFKALSNGNNLRISIFGAGYGGLQTYTLLSLCRMKIDCFIDNNPQKHGLDIKDGIVCKDINELLGERERLLIVVAINNNNIQVQQELKNMGFKYFITKQQIDELLSANLYIK
jgi:hypothetical protein